MTLHLRLYLISRRVADQRRLAGRLGGAGGVAGSGRVHDLMLQVHTESRRRGCGGLSDELGHSVCWGADGGVRTHEVARGNFHGKIMRFDNKRQGLLLEKRG